MNSLFKRCLRESFRDGCRDPFSWVHRRLYSNRTQGSNLQDSKTRKVHRFEYLHDWKETEGLANHLLENIIHQDDNILVFNKPSGVPMHDLQYMQQGADNPEKAVSIKRAVDVIKERLRIDHLKDVYSQPRLYSGVVVFAKTKEAERTLSRYFVYTQKQKVKHQKHRTIVCGVPQEVDTNIVFPIMREKTEDGIWVYFKSPTTGKKHFIHRVTNKFEMEFKVLSKARIGYSQVSYVEVDSYLSKWNAIELCLTQHHLCPVLGDDLYSHRLKILQGQKVLIGPQVAPVERQPQELEGDIARALALESTENLPIHMHCIEVQIPKRLNIPLDQGSRLQKQKLVTYKADLPEFFTTSLKQLNLTSEKSS